MSKETKRQPRYVNFFGHSIKKGFMYYTAIIAGVILSLTILSLIVFRLAFVNFIDNYEIAYRYDTWGEHRGEIRRINKKGYVVTPPFKTKVHTIDGRPFQVCISSIKRVLNCKLVQFNPDGLELFLELHGRRSYVITDTVNADGSDPENSLNAYLKAYAYEESGNNYPFLTVIRELRSVEKSDATPAQQGSEK